MAYIVGTKGQVVIAKEIRERLGVKPGLTCIWQVTGRSDIGFERWMELDVQYVHTRSLWLDLKILLQTIPAVVTGRGAY